MTFGTNNSNSTSRETRTMASTTKFMLKTRFRCARQSKSHNRTALNKFLAKESKNMIQIR